MSASGWGTTEQTGPSAEPGTREFAEQRGPRLDQPLVRQVPALTFEYKKDRLEGTPKGYRNVNGYQVVYVTRWLGGAVDRGPTASSGCFVSPQINYRTTWQKNTRFYRGSNRAVTIGGAANLGFVNLNATSGYSTYVDMDWNMVRNWCYICGYDNYPPYSKIVYIS